MNGNAQPLEIAMDFIKRINAGDINALCELMTENHIFQDALGKRFMGRETMRQGWTQYFKMVADYQVHADEFFQTDERVAIFGTASGRYVGPHGPSAKAGNGRAETMLLRKAWIRLSVRMDSGKCRRRGERSCRTGRLQNGAFMRTINRCAN